MKRWKRRWNCHFFILKLFKLKNKTQLRKRKINKNKILYPACLSNTSVLIKSNSQTRALRQCFRIHKGNKKYIVIKDTCELIWTFETLNLLLKISVYIDKNRYLTINWQCFKDNIEKIQKFVHSPVVFNFIIFFIFFFSVLVLFIFIAFLTFYYSPFFFFVLFLISIHTLA